MTQPPGSPRTPYRDWVRVWLAGLAFFYPVFWLANYIVFALPALVRVAVFQERLEDFALGPFGAFASSAPAVAGAGAAPRQGSPSALGIEAVIALAVVGLLALAGRRHRTLSGLTTAMLADVLLIRSVAGVLFFRRGGESESWTAWLGAALFFALLCLGLFWMLDAWVLRGLWARTGSALAGFVLPSTAALVGSRWLSFAFRPITLLLVVPGVVAALVAALGPRSGKRLESDGEDSHAAGWATVAWGVVATAVLAAGIGPASRVINEGFRRARSLQARAELAAIPDLPAHAPYPRIFFQRGVNFTAEWPNRYDSEGARRMLRLLPQYGVNAIALVPYGWSTANPPRVRIGGGPDTWESDEGVMELARLAHSLGMKVLLKPAIWESYKIDIPSPQDRTAWFGDYALFLDHYARLAKQIHADVFFVGGEFNHLSRYDADWRRLIARARQSYPGPLVYGANFGEEFESITFWDALDYIGLQEYYPLPDGLSTGVLAAKVAAVQARYSKPVIFTEAGFPSSTGANRQPWEDGHGQIAPEEQARCYDAVFGAFYKRPWFEGVYWWKVGTDGGGGPADESLTPWGKPAMDVVKRWYTTGGR